MSTFDPKHVCDYSSPTPNVCIGCAYEQGIKDGYQNGYLKGSKDTHEVATHAVANLVEAYYRDLGNSDSAHEEHHAVEVLADSEEGDAGG